MMKNFVWMMCAGASVLLANPVMAACNANIELHKPNAQYLVHEDGTVTDSVTGLMWQQCSLGLGGSDCATGTAVTRQWDEALQAAQLANAGEGFAGYTDWRLPNKKELASLVEKACDSPAINAAIFPATLFDIGYWTSTPDSAEGKQAWSINFSTGADDATNKRGNFYVRLVRNVD